ncbi:hypothetical protein GBAR_LOCUS26102, partial [Geodia barretti]
MKRFITNQPSTSFFVWSEPQCRWPNRRMQGIFGEQERELNDCICTSHPSLFTTYTLEPR